MAQRLIISAVLIVALSGCGGAQRADEVPTTSPSEAVADETTTGVKPSDGQAPPAKTPCPGGEACAESCEGDCGSPKETSP